MKKKGMHKGVEVSIEGGVNGLHLKYYRQIEDHDAVRGFTCLLLSHIHVRSEQRRREREIEKERTRRETAIRNSRQLQMNYIMRWPNWHD